MATIAVYSLRAREYPTVSTPITWDEVERALKKKDAEMLVFRSSDTVKRFEKMGDLFEPVLELKQKLPQLKAATPALASHPETIDIAAEADDHQPRKARTKAVKKSAAPKKRSKV